MAEQLIHEQTTDPGPISGAPPQLDTPLATVNDPGGAHGKGFSADPQPEMEAEPDGPLPLAAGPDTHPAVHVPERDNHVQPTGRSEPGTYTPNDRLMGADR
jgi:hypothetical protein